MAPCVGARTTAQAATRWLTAGQLEMLKSSFQVRLQQAAAVRRQAGCTQAAAWLFKEDITLSCSLLAPASAQAAPAWPASSLPDEQRMLATHSPQYLQRSMRPRRTASRTPSRCPVPLRLRDTTGNGLGSCEVD